MHICTNADLCCWALQVLAKKSGSSSSSKSRRRRNGDDSGETASSFLCGGFMKTRILCETTWIYPMRFWVAYWLLGWPSAVTAAALGWEGVGVKLRISRRGERLETHVSSSSLELTREPLRVAPPPPQFPPRHHLTMTLTALPSVV